MRPEIAVIGYGRFGRCAAHHLGKRFTVVAADMHAIRNPEPGVKRVTIETAARKRTVLLAVPINRMPSLLKEIAPHLSPGTLVCDVCSVKAQPVQWMRKLLPPHVQILGMHPLFGPDSASSSLRGRTIILCPVRLPRRLLSDIRSALVKAGLTVRTMSPTEHDRQMATTLFLTQLIGRGLSRVNMERIQHSTQHVHFLQQLVRTANNDTQELFRDMYRYNKFARSIPARLIRSLQKTYRSLDGSHPSEKKR